VFRNPYNATFTKLWSTDKASNLFRADIIVYLNIIGVVYMLIHSIFLRRTLVRMSIELDKKTVTPSDFAVVVRNIPNTITEVELKAQIESNFKKMEVKVQYINYCHDITEVIQLDQRLKELGKEKSWYKLHLKKEKASRGIKNSDIKSNPYIIAPPSYKTGLFSSKVLNLKTIENEFKEIFNKM
jgi:hypothetical protein